MSGKPTYEELEKRVQELEQAHSGLKMAESALRESEDRYRLQIQNITDVVYAVDKEFTLIDVSPSVERVLGYKPEELIGRPFQDTHVLAPEYMEQAIRDIFRVLEGERIGSTEYLFIHRNGEKRWGEVSRAPIITEGQIIGLISVARDITKRKNTEDSLKFERDFSSRIMETSPAGITHVDPDGHVIYANKKAQEILGFRLATDGRRTYNDTAWKITGLDGEPFPNENLPFTVVKKTLKPVSDVQHAIEWPDGKTAFLSINAAPLFSASGEFEGMVATFDDITDQYRAKESLQRSEERFSSMFEHMGTGVAVYEAVDGGSDFIFRAFNPAAEKITRIAVSQALGKRLLELFPQMDESGLLGSLQRVWRTGRNEHIPPFYYKDKIREGWRENRIYKLPSGEIVALFDDVTQRINAEKALRESEAQKNAILDSSIDSIRLVDKNMRIIWTNKIIEKQVNVKRNEIIGKFCYKVYTGRDKPRPDCPTLKAQKSGKTEHSIICEENVKGIPGKTYWADYTVPLKDESGKIVKFLQVSRDITTLKRAEEEKEKVILELKKAMSNVKTLSGLLPICSICKKIRDDRGYWNQIESYIHNHSGAEFSHGICPECAKKHYPDMDIYDD